MKQLHPIIYLLLQYNDDVIADVQNVITKPNLQSEVQRTKFT